MNLFAWFVVIIVAVISYCLGCIFGAVEGERVGMILGADQHQRTPPVCAGCGGPNTNVYCATCNPKNPRLCGNTACRMAYGHSGPCCTNPACTACRP